MILKDWIKVVSPFVDVIIFDNEEEDPVYEGTLLNIPWWIVECKLDESIGDEPIEIFKDSKTNNIYISIHIILK